MVTSIQPTVTSTTDAEQVATQLQRFYAAWCKRTGAEARVLFSDSDDLTLWGVSDYECIVGRRDADRDFDAWLDTCPPWVSIEPSSRVLRVNGDVAWSADEVIGSWREAGRTNEMPFRVSTVWQRAAGEWRVSHLHVAIPAS